MLVLTRRKEETIVIGDTIQITVLGIRGEQVRLGITAPPEISVHRKEIYDSLAQTNRAALRGSGGLRSLLKILRGRPAPRTGPRDPRAPREEGGAPPRRDGPPYRGRSGTPRGPRGPRPGGPR